MFAAKTASTPRRTLVAAWAAARPVLPSCSSRNVSFEKVENVVKPPQSPT